MLKSSTSKRKYRAPLTETIGVAPQRSTWMRPNCFIALEVDLSNGKRWLLANWQDSQTELLLSCFKGILQRDKILETTSKEG